MRNDDNSANSRRDDRVRAGRSLAKVATWLKRDEQRRSSSRFSRRGKCVHFSVRTAEPFVPTFTQDTSLIVGDNRTHGGIGFNSPNPSSRQFQGTRQQRLIK